MKNSKNLMGVKSRTSKQIVSAGLTLGVGMIIMPFIPFKETKNYKPFKRVSKGGK
jgi:hypothetical protein